MRLIIFLTAAVVAGIFLVPPVRGLGELAKIIFFHVPAAWVSVVGFFVSAFYAARFLRTGEIFFDERARAKVSAVYSLLSVVTVPFLVFILPRMYFSLHPSPVINSAGKLEMDAEILAVLIAAVLDATLIFYKFMKR